MLLTMISKKENEIVKRIGKLKEYYVTWKKTMEALIQQEYLTVEEIKKKIPEHILKKVKDEIENE